MDTMPRLGAAPGGNALVRYVSYYVDFKKGQMGWVLGLRSELSAVAVGVAGRMLQSSRLPACIRSVIGLRSAGRVPAALI